MDSESLNFPDNFFWGTSLSSHQSEGGNHNSWTEWEKLPGRIKNNEQSGAAAEHWSRYAEDFKNLQWLNADTHRFSIEWSRLEPEEGRWNGDAFEHYRTMLSTLKDLNVRPMVCLFHFTLPLWLAEKGGFENPAAIHHFERFAEVAQERLGDLVAHWLTVNEPTVYALAAYAAGLTPPGVQDFPRTMKVMVNLLRAHGRAYHAIKKLNPLAQVSFAQHLRVYAPKKPWSVLDRLGAKIADQVMNWSWYETIQTGQVKVNVPFVFKANETAPECLGALDFLAFNYYSRDLVSLKPFTKQKFFVSTAPEFEKTDMGWDIHPEGIAHVLQGIKNRGLGRWPLLISENGLADAGDRLRARFIYEHLKVFLEACRRFELRPMGYLYWSLIDNFEWIDGFGPRFGLFEVDYATQARHPRASAHYFRELGKQRRLFAPDSSVSDVERS